jgi:hypothetical protein
MSKKNKKNKKSYKIHEIMVQPSVLFHNINRPMTIPVELQVAPENYLQLVSASLDQDTSIGETIGLALSFYFDVLYQNENKVQYYFKEEGSDELCAIDLTMNDSCEREGN